MDAEEGADGDADQIGDPDGQSDQHENEYAHQQQKEVPEFLETDVPPADPAQEHQRWKVDPFRISPVDQMEQDGHRGSECSEKEKRV